MAFGAGLDIFCRTFHCDFGMVFLSSLPFVSRGLGPVENGVHALFLAGYGQHVLR